MGGSVSMSKAGTGHFVAGHFVAGLSAAGLFSAWHLAARKFRRLEILPRRHFAAGYFIARSYRR